MEASRDHVSVSRLVMLVIGRACLVDEPAERPTAGELDELLEPLGDWSVRAIRRLR